MEDFTVRQIEIIEAATRRIDQYGIQNLTIKNLAADIKLSEPALYRHFRSKNDILLSLLNYFIHKMENRIGSLAMSTDKSAKNGLKELFDFQLKSFTEKPAVVSVIFAENIFHFDEGLSRKVSEILDMMHQYVESNIRIGQKSGEYNSLIHASTLATIILGGIRLTVLKWKLARHQTNLIKDGKEVINGIIKMIETNK